VSESSNEGRATNQDGQWRNQLHIHQCHSFLRQYTKDGHKSGVDRCHHGGPSTTIVLRIAWRSHLQKMDLWFHQSGIGWYPHEIILDTGRTKGSSQHSPKQVSSQRWKMKPHGSMNQCFHHLRWSGGPTTSYSHWRYRRGPTSKGSGATYQWGVTRPPYCGLSGPLSLHRLGMFSRTAGWSHKLVDGVARPLPCVHLGRLALHWLLARIPCGGWSKASILRRLGG